MVIFDYTPIILGSWKPRDQNFETECLWNQHVYRIQATPTFEHGWTTPRQTVVGGSYKYKEWHGFLRGHEHSNCNIYGTFFICPFHLKKKKFTHQISNSR